MVANELCESIIRMDNKIMFVAVISEKGRIEESQSRNSIIEKIPSVRKEMFFMENALRHRMRNDFDEYLGSVRFTYVERAKRGILSFPMEDKLLLVSFRTSVNPLLLAKSIMRLIHRYEKKISNMR
jgi:hypothetical protein